MTISNVLPNPSGGDAPTVVTPRALNHDETTTTQDLLQAVLAGDNLVQAWKRVKANKGSAGVDRMTVDGITDYLKQHWPAIREQLLSGTYEPKPVRRVEIAKPDGGIRKLGIPTVASYYDIIQH